jgi:hypothetical protein
MYPVGTCESGTVSNFSSLDLVTAAGFWVAKLIKRPRFR